MQQLPFAGPSRPWPPLTSSSAAWLPQPHSDTPQPTPLPCLRATGPSGPAGEREATAPGWTVSGHEDRGRDLGPDRHSLACLRNQQECYEGASENPAVAGQAGRSYPGPVSRAESWNMAAAWGRGVRLAPLPPGERLLQPQEATEPPAHPSRAVSISCPPLGTKVMVQVAGGKTEAWSQTWLMQGHRARKRQTLGGSDLRLGHHPHGQMIGVPGPSTIPASHPSCPSCPGHPCTSPSWGPGPPGSASRRCCSGMQNWPLNTSVISCRGISLFPSRPRHRAAPLRPNEL